MPKQKKPQFEFRHSTTKEDQRELEKRLPELKEALARLEHAKRVSPETLHLRFTI